ncbi:MAG: hypothetical protein GY861_17170 [bacterium]|nr:hypothetical protein [bacterium]
MSNEEAGALVIGIFLGLIIAGVILGLTSMNYEVKDNDLLDETCKQLFGTVYKYDESSDIRDISCHDINGDSKMVYVRDHQRKLK